MSEMIERVRAALEVALGPEVLRLYPVPTRLLARAAIAAMREPTETMIEAVYIAKSDRDHGYSRSEAKVNHKAMIDKALED